MNDSRSLWKLRRSNSPTQEHNLFQASIHRLAENEFISGRIIGDNQMWLGLVRDEGEIGMHWSDNSEWNFESWAETGIFSFCLILTLWHFLNYFFVPKLSLISITFELE